MGGSAGTNAAKSENADSTGWEKSAVGTYNADHNAYMSNINAALAQGNPYQSQAYKTEQNLATSGAMNATDNAAGAAMRGNALRTGQNAAANNAALGQVAQEGQRTLDTYNAERDTANTDKWQQQKQQLYGDQFQGAGQDAGMVGTYAGQRGQATQGLLQDQQARDQMWAQLGSAAMQGAGAGLGSAFAGKA